VKRALRSSACAFGGLAALGAALFAFEGTRTA
jgi:hypothetical protein